MAVYTNAVRVNQTVDGIHHLGNRETYIYSEIVEFKFPFSSDVYYAGNQYGGGLSNCCKIVSLKLHAEYRGKYEDSNLTLWFEGLITTKFQRILKVNNNTVLNNSLGSKDGKDGNYSVYDETFDNILLSPGDELNFTFIVSRDDGMATYDNHTRIRNAYVEYVRKRACYVTFTGDGVNYSKTEYDFGVIPSYGGVPSRHGYTFIGWKSSLTNQVYTTLPAAGEVDVIDTAQWERLPEYTVSLETYENGYISDSTKVERLDNGVWTDITGTAVINGCFHNISAFLNDRIRIYVSRGTHGKSWEDAYYSLDSSEEIPITTDSFVLVFDGTVERELYVKVTVYERIYEADFNTTGRFENIVCPHLIYRGVPAEILLVTAQNFYLSTFIVNGENKISDLLWASANEYCYAVENPTRNLNITAEASRSDATVFRSYVSPDADHGEIKAPLTITYGTSENIFFVPDEHAVLTGAFLDGVSIFDELEWSGKTAKYVLNDNNEDKTNYFFSACFEAVVFITLDVGEHGTITGPERISPGIQMWYSVDADENYSIKAIYVDGEKVFQAEKRTTAYNLYLGRVYDDKTIMAEFTDDMAEISVEEPEHGEIILMPDKYLNGAVIEIGATADNGYYFEKWEDDSTENPRSFTVNGDYTLGASFLPFLYEIKLSVVNGHGKIEADRLFANYNETITVKAVADEGYKFKTWSDGVLDAERELIVVEDISISAEFEKDSFILQVEVEEGGTVTGSGTYLYESEIEVTAKANIGYYFHQWLEDEYPYSNRIFVIPARNTVLTAQFKKYEFDITVETGAGGKSNGSQTVKYGDDFVLNITSDIGYKISDIILDGKTVFSDLTTNKAGGIYTIPNVTAGHTVTILFTERLYSFTRKMLDYYPPVLQRILELQALMASQEYIVGEAWDDISFITDNQFIDTATDEGVRKWESELDIVPNATDTLKDRKQRLKLKWVPAPCYTMAWLVNYLQAACDRSDITLPQLKDYTLRVNLPSACNYREIFADIRRYIPANIILDRIVELQPSVHNLAVGSISIWLVNITSEIPNLNQEVEA